MSQNVGLTPKQARAVAALLEQPTIGEAAAAASVNKRTLERWLALPCFRAALKTGQQTAIDTAARRLAGGMGKALDVLKEIMHDPDERSSNRIRAAAVWLDQAKLTELQEIEERLARLEERLRGSHEL